MPVLTVFRATCSSLLHPARRCSSLLRPARRGSARQRMPYVRVRAEGASSAAVEPPALSGYRQRLQYQVSLTGAEAVVSLLVSASACAVYYVLTAPAQTSLRYGLSQTLLFAATLTVCRSWLLERQHQSHMSAEQELKDTDSVFRELHGTTVHYKLAQGIKPEHPIAVHCYHGFGANTFSWSYVYKSLSEQLHAQVTKHDMPGFGLTLRPRDLSGYTLDYNGRLGRYVMDAELAAVGLLPQARVPPGMGPAVSMAELQSVSKNFQPGQKESEPAPDAATLQAAAAKQAASTSTSKQQPQSPTSALDFPSSDSDTSNGGPEATSHGDQGVRVKRVLVGHSVGAACAAAEYINHPEEIDGLVLVAPAITAFSADLKAQSNAANRADETSKPDPPQGNKGIRVLTAITKALASRITGVILWLAQPVLVLILRSLVRSREFWKKGVSNAWHSREGVSDELLDAYRLPQLVRGWEIGLVRFVRARVADDRSLAEVWRDAYAGKVRKSQALQLADAVQQHQIPVLIVHGSRDRLVPLSNSRRLATLVPNTKLVELQNCGHTPQEELPSQFTDAVKAYMASLQ